MCKDKEYLKKSEEQFFNEVLTVQKGEYYIELNKCLTFY